ncbi:DUF6629 family protein [Sphingopyxis chilensis]
MCFSAQASFVAGSVLLAVGAVTLKQVRVRSELPYAAIPGLFGVQQLIEGGLWLALASGQSHLVSALTHLYAFFSHVLWPVFVPLAVLAIEPVGWRRRLLAAFAVAGGATGFYQLYFLLTEPTFAQVVGRHVDYISPHFYVPAVLALYVLATCGSSLASSHRRVRWFGIATFVSLIAAGALYQTWFISVWCFFAAGISWIVLLHFLEPRSSETSRLPAISR